MPALFRYVVVALFFAPIMGFVRTAHAQASITVSTITRSASAHPNNLNPTWISRADCLADDVISVSLSVVNTSLLPAFQVWASQGANDCRTDANRNVASTAVCGLILTSGSLGSNVPVIDLHDRDILYALSHLGPTPSQGLGTTVQCTDSTQTNTQPQPLTLWFMFVDNGGVADQGSITTIATKYALLGPSPPLDLTSGPGDGIIKLDWTAADVGTVSSYVFFCDPQRGTEGDAGWMVSGSDGAANPNIDAGSPASTDASVCSDAQADDDAGDEGGTTAQCVAATTPTTTATAAEASTANPFCGSGVLAAGEIPDDTNQLVALHSCGGADGSTANTGLVEGLQNGDSYAVSVAALDGLGNIGALSTPLCETPTKISDFFTVLRGDGGTAGGSSFCTVSRLGAGSRRPGWAGWGLAGLVALAQLRRIGKRRNGLRQVGISRQIVDEKSVE